MSQIKKQKVGKKSVLVLGSGLVVKPGVEYMAKQPDVFDRILLASRTESKATAIAAACREAGATVPIVTSELDVTKPEHASRLTELVSQVDGVLSLLPYLFHAQVAEEAIRQGKYFFTTSYESPELKALGEKAKEKGLVMLNECGVDPGTDHMSAMRTIDEIHAKGGRVVELASFCGGLPAPDANDNPFGYKFSWAPRGVLLAAKNTATVLEDGKAVTRTGKEVYSTALRETVRGIALERFPLRDGTQFVEPYKLGGEVRKFHRGTYRMAGAWCDAIMALDNLGYLSLDLVPASANVVTYLDLARHLLGVSGDAAAVRAAVAKKLEIAADSDLFKHFDFLDLFGDEAVPKDKAPLDVLCAAMEKRMQYAPGERDMIIMRHEYVCEYEDRHETVETVMNYFGVPNGDTAMARTVSWPIGIAITKIYSGEIVLAPGTYRPTIPELYNPILDELSKLGVEYTDEVVSTTQK
jgi:saccharopine dehydrogenase-like NADP-dependent oxidoreductase